MEELQKAKESFVGKVQVLTKEQSSHLKIFMQVLNLRGSTAESGAKTERVKYTGFKIQVVRKSPVDSSESKITATERSKVENESQVTGTESMMLKTAKPIPTHGIALSQVRKSFQVVNNLFNSALEDNQDEKTVKKPTPGSLPRLNPQKKVPVQEQLEKSPQVAKKRKMPHPRSAWNRDRKKFTGAFEPMLFRRDRRGMNHLFPVGPGRKLDPEYCDPKSPAPVRQSKMQF